MTQLTILNLNQRAVSQALITAFVPVENVTRNKGSLPLEEYLLYIEPMEVSENIQDGRFEQQLQYLVQSLKYLNGRILNEGFSEEQALERIYQTVEQVENTVKKLKVDILEMGKSEIPAT